MTLIPSASDGCGSGSYAMVGQTEPEDDNDRERDNIEEDVDVESNGTHNISKATNDDEAKGQYILDSVCLIINEIDWLNFSTTFVRILFLYRILS